MKESLGWAKIRSIEPVAEETRVRYRVDGKLNTSLILPKNVHAAIVARIKVLANLKLDEKNLIVSAISIEKGPFLKRWQPVARGTAHAYKKRSSHLKIKVAEKTAKITEKKAELSAENKTAESKPAAKIKEKGRDEVWKH